MNESIPQTILVLDVVNKAISRMIVQIMRARREGQERRLKRMEKQEEPTLLGNSSSKEDEEVNLCLMAKEELETSSVSSSTTIHFENYSQLLDALKETHE